MATNQDVTTQTLRCPYCGAVHQDRSTMVERKIIQRENRPPFRGLRESMLWFCKDKDCGGNYQMGCEG